MRKLFCVLVILLNVSWVTSALAQNTIPNYGIFFQAVARDNFSNPAKDRVVFVESSILQFTANGTKVLTELHQTTTDGLGVFSINIGSGQRIGGTLSGLDKVDWANGPYFLGLKIAIKPLSPVSNWDYTKELIDLGASSFGTVPYAYYSGSTAGVKDVVKTSDTAAMLLPYAKASALQQTNTNLGLKVNVADSTTIYVTPTQLRAVKFDTTAIYNRLSEREVVANKSLNVTTDATSDTKYPSVRAIKSYVDLQFSNFVLADGSVSAAKIANGAVTDAKIASVSGSKVTGDIAGNAATATLAANATKLATPRTINGVAFDGTSNITIATGSTVTDANATTKGVVQLAGDLAGTAAQPVVAANTITTSKIADGAVTDAKITSVAGSKVTGDIAGNAATATLAANATKLATPRTINGVAFDGSSNITIATGSNPTDATSTSKGIVQLAGDLTGTASQPVVAANAITTSKIADGAVTDAKINAVAGSKLTGTVALANGGTGATTAAGARTNLGLVIGTDVLAQRTFGSAANNNTNDFVATTEKGANNGVATLGNDGKIPSAQIPAVSFQSATVVSSQAAMLALSNAVVGSIAIRTDNNKNYVLSSLPSSTLANWIELATPSSVTSVNGFAGPNVVLTATDINGVEVLTNKSNNIANDAQSTTKYPSVKAIKDYVDQQSANAGVADNSITSNKINGTIAIAKGGTGATNAADARTNLGLVIGTDVMSATATTTLTGDVAGSGNGSIATTVNSVGGVSSNTISTFDTRITSNTSSITTNTANILLKAPINSPAFTGTPTAPTPATSDNSTKVATTEYVKNSITAANAGISSIGNISGTSNVKGATISGTTELILTPADATNGGVLTSGAQTIAGAKTFNANVTAPNFVGNLTGNATTATTASNITATSNSTLTSLPNLNTVGTITSGTWSGTAIAVANGGTGATNAADARTNLGLTIGTDVMAANATTTLTGDVTGSGSGTFTTTLSNSGVTAGSYGSSTAIPTLTVDSKGRVTSAGTVGIIAGVNSLNYTSTTSYAAGGTISGTSLTLAAADATNPGLISTGAQTIAGAKTFNANITAPNFVGDLTGNASTATNATTATTAGNITATSNNTLTSLPNLNTVGTITGGTWSGTAISVANGGTGATNAADARTNLGVTIGTDVMAANATTTLTGDVTGTGSGTFTTTLSNSGVTAGSYGSSTAIPTLTVDSKGRITSAGTVGIIAGVNSLNYTSTTSYAAGGTISGTSLTLAAADATNPGLISTGAQTIAGAKTFNANITAPNFVGDLTGNASTATIATTATTAGNITATSNNTLTSLPNLNTVGTITGGTWSGTAISVANGGTGATSAADARTNLGVIASTEKGANNGVATLGNDGKIPSIQIPSVSFQSASVVASEAAMLALSSSVVGSIAIRTDNNRNYVLSATPASTLSNWIQLATPSSVTSVNGNAGPNVVLTAADISGVELASNKSTSISTDALSTTKYPSVKLIKDYVDQQNANAGVADNSITSSKISGAIAIAKGGTGATTASDARTNLGLTIGTDVMAANATTTLTGDVTGTGSGTFTTTLSNSGVTAGSYGSSTAIPTLTVDSKGRITSAGTVGITAGVSSLNYTSTISYAAGGAISGTSLTLAAADGSNPGLISTGAQTIAGAKTFNANVTAPNFIGNATSATNLSGGVSGSIPYQTAAGTTAMIPVGTANQFLTSVAGGTYTWTSASAVSGVPYVGATQAVNLGAYDLTVNGLTVGTGVNGGTLSNTAFGFQALAGNNSGTGKNTAIGYSALNKNTTGRSNTAVGYNSLLNLTNTLGNTAIGTEALEKNIANGNTAVGAGAGYFLDNTSFYYNTFLGYGAGAKARGQYNIAIGNLALEMRNSSTFSGADKNIAIGNGAMSLASRPVANVVIGDNAGAALTFGSWNTFLGQQSGETLTEGYHNTIIGDSTGMGITTGSNNTILGSRVGGLSATLSGNIILADGAGNVRAQHDGVNGWSLGTISSGTWSGTAIAIANGGTGATTKAAAFNALSPMTTSGDIIYGGASGAGTRLGVGTTGQVLTVSGGVPAWTTPTGVTTMAAIGSTPNANGASISGSTLTLQPADSNFGGLVTTLGQTFAGAKIFNSNITSNGVVVGRLGSPDNLVVGFSALNSNGSQFNTAIGDYTLNSVTSSGSSNVAVGYASLYNTTSGTNNVSVGRNALSGATTGSNNTALGDRAGNLITTGNGNVFLGSDAGRYIGTTGTTGNTTGSNGIFIGYQTSALSNGGSNEVVISGGSVRTAGLGSNTTLIGNSSTTNTRIMGALDLPSTTASTSISTGALTLGGGAGIAGALNVGGTTTLIGASTISNTTNSTNTTTGALVVRGGVGVASNVTIGGTLEIDGGSPGAGKVLTSDASGLASWTYNGGNTSIQTGSYTITLLDRYVFYNGTATATFTLPAASNNAGKEIIIKNKSAFVLTVQRSGSETIFQENSIGGTNTITVGIEASNNWVKLVSDGTQWNVFRALF